jgi:hypothetical protein
MVLIESRKGKFEFKNAGKIRGTRIYFPRTFNLAAIFRAGNPALREVGCGHSQSKIALYVLYNLDEHFMTR